MRDGEAFWASGLLILAWSVGYYVHDLDPFIIRLGDSWGLRWYGMAYLLAFVVGFFLYRRLAEMGFSRLKPAEVGDFILGTAIFGVMLGGRLGYMLFYRWDDFVSEPWIFFRVHEGGMSAHGGILGVTLFSLWYAWRHRVGWLNLGDNLVVVAPLGLLMGRVANFINGELYGRVAQVPWAVIFPLELYDDPGLAREAIRRATQIDASWGRLEVLLENLRREDSIREILADILPPRHPSQLYEAALEGALLFGVLWLLRTRFQLREGILTGIFFIGYAVLRSFCEFFREPDSPLVGILTRGQFLSIFLIFAGVGFLLASRNRPVVGPACGREAK